MQYSTSEAEALGLCAKRFTWTPWAAVAAIPIRKKVQAFYEALRAKGKPAKLAPIAITRKLIIILNGMLRDKSAF